VRVFVAGASGVLGVCLVPLLVELGHEVAAMTRTPAKASMLASLGAEPVVCDVYDAGRLSEEVRSFRPDAVMHQLTDLPDDVGRIAEFAEANRRIRGEGTSNLLDAARSAGATHIVAQSVSWELSGEAARSISEHEHAVLGAGGVVVRYGQFYGPGTYYPTHRPNPPRVEVSEAARQSIGTLFAPPGTIVVINEAREP
jgi:nucleoside-diphosphate-sugar epimerase